MKKAFSFLFIVALFMIVCFTGCDKEITYKVRITCCQTETGIDTGAVIPNCQVKIGKDNYAEYAQASGVTDENGVFEYTFAHEALLSVDTYCEVVQVNEETGEETADIYVGSGQVKLLPNEVVEETILMMRQ